MKHLTKDRDVGGSRKIKTLSQLGERKIIQEILKILRDSPSNVLGRSDDSAVYDIGFDKYLVVSTDRIPIPYGLSLGLLSFEGMGRYFACSTMNAVIAKGAETFAMLVSLGVPRNMTLRQLTSFYNGLHDITRKYKVTIIGGDTKPQNSLSYEIC